MIHVECAVPLHAARAAAWELLKRNVEMPQEFAPHIAACDIVQRSESEIVRRIRFDDGTAVTERVVLVPEDEVVFQFVDHPKFEGAIRNCLFQLEDELWLAFGFQGQVRAGVELAPAELQQVRDALARAVRAVAHRIEQADREALGATA